MTLTRVPDWDRALPLVIERHMALPGEWGVSDCMIVAGDAIEAVTGVDPMAPYRGRYKTEAGAARLMRKNGCETVDDFLRKVFGLAPVGRLMAQRGDVGTVMQGGQLTAGVVTERGFAAKGEHGLVFHEVTDIVSAFKVGRE